MIRRIQPSSSDGYNVGIKLGIDEETDLGY